MNALRCGVGLAVVVLVTIGCARADIINSMAELQANPRAAAYFKPAATTEAVAQMAIEKEKKFGVQTECSTHDAKLLMMDVLAPIDFPAEQAHPVKGRWQAVIQLNRCGQRRAYSAIVGAVDGAAPKPRFLSAGFSLADERLMLDSVGSAMLGVMLKAPETSDCKDIDFFNVVVTEPPTQPSSKNGHIMGKWKERWTFWCCGKLHSVDMRFEPDQNGNGTRVYVDPGIPTKRP